MKNKAMWSIVLILLPLVALGLAAMPDSVTVLVSEGEMQTLSYFGTLQDGSRPTGLAFAGLLCIVTAAAAMIGAVSKKEFWLSGVVWISMGAAILSVLPLLLRSSPPVLPNVVVAILLCTESMTAYLCRNKMGKDANSAPKGERL